MIHVIATVTAVTGQREAVLEEFHRIVPAVQAEQGCIEYGPAVDIDSGLGAQKNLGTDKFMVIEKWESIEALTAHTTAPHMLEYRDKVKDKILSTELNVLQPA